MVDGLKILAILYSIPASGSMDDQVVNSVTCWESTMPNTGLVVSFNSDVVGAIKDRY